MSTGAGVPDSGRAARAFAALESDLLSALRPAHHTVVRNVHDSYQQAVTAALVGFVADTDRDTRLAVSQRILDRLADRGVGSFTDRGGRVWQLETYAEMAARTAIIRVMRDAQIDRIAAGGHDLIVVTDHLGACPLCRPFEGAVLSIGGPSGDRTVTHRLTGADVRVEVHATLWGAVARGLFHPNCRHAVAPYLPGVTAPAGAVDDDTVAYADRQRLRELERHVRRWKRREAAALTPPTREKARQRVRGWQAEIRRHTATTSAKRQPLREQINKAR